jgi:hypothetical protein
VWGVAVAAAAAVMASTAWYTAFSRQLAHLVVGRRTTHDLRRRA